MLRLLGVMLGYLGVNPLKEMQPQFEVLSERRSPLDICTPMTFHRRPIGYTLKSFSG